MNVFARTALASLMLAAILATPRSYGQAAAQRVRFETCDEVELHGTFYAGNKKSPTVIMLHKMGGHSKTQVWTKFAQELSKEGYAVLTFDFRGHGGSTSVGKDFLAAKYAYNRGARPAGNGKSISHKNFVAEYFPYLVNDLTATKTYLEQRNDAGDCNASNLILIAEEDAAVLATMWAASECFRYKVIEETNVLGGVRLVAERKPQSRDVVAMLFLSPTTTLRKRSYSGQLGMYARILGREQRIPAAVIYGEDDRAGGQLAAKLEQVIKPKEDKDGTTGIHAVKKTDVRGGKLLEDSFDGKSWILEKYLKVKIRPLRAIHPWEKRDTKENYYWWDFYPRRVRPETTMAKSKTESHVRPAPVSTMVKPAISLTTDTP